MKYFTPCCLIACFLFLTATVSAEPERFKPADSKGVTATRDSDTVYLKIDADVDRRIWIPRLAAPLESITWLDSPTDDGLLLEPGADQWFISWKKRPAADATLVLKFGAPPLRLQEIKPVDCSTDGSFMVPAYLADTRGNKIRYEPQPFKNTVGFWTTEKDAARWPINLQKPGRFSVAVLQGCGKNQGGSSGTITFRRHRAEDDDASLSFKAVETGHWQNFQWVQLGEIELKEPGKVWVKVTADEIKKAAFMDIRAIHLIRLPDKKK